MEFKSNAREKDSSMSGGGGGGGGGDDAEDNATPFNALREAFTAHLVLPDVVNRLPSAKLNLAYDNASIELGNLIAPENTDRRPIVNFSEYKENAFYTLIMTDPDVPNRAMPTEREYLHWMAINITKNCLDKGELIAPYEPPLPKRGSGLHRYVFVLLEQSAPIVFDSTDLHKSTVTLSNAKTTDNAKTEKSSNALATPLFNKDGGLRSTSGERSRPHSTASRPTHEQTQQKNQRGLEHESSYYGVQKTDNYDIQNVSSQTTQSHGSTNMCELPSTQKESDAKFMKDGRSGTQKEQMEKNENSKEPLKLHRGSDSWSDLPLAENLCDKKVVIGYSDQKYHPLPTNHSSSEESTDARKAKKSESTSSPSLPSVLKTPMRNVVNENIQRSGFSTKTFMTKYMIRSVAAANFFQTEYNDYVGERLNVAAGEKSRDNSAKSTRDNSVSKKIGKASSGVEVSSAPSVKFAGNAFVKKESAPTNASATSRSVPATTVKTIEKKLDRTTLSRK